MMNNGVPYGPHRYKEIVKECYLITRNMNTSYEEIMNMNPLEREYLLKFLADEIQRTNDEIRSDQFHDERQWSYCIWLV